MLQRAERDKLIEEHMGMVPGLAHQIRNLYSTGMELEEIEAYGVSGLVDAAGRWDPSRGVAFSTFAHYRIRGAIFDGMRKQGVFKHRDLVAFADGANRYLQSRSDAQPAGGTQAADAAQKVSALAGTLRDLTTIYVTSINRAPDAEPADKRRPDAVEVLARQQRRRRVHQALEGLPERERRLLRLHYFEGLTLTQAGERLGMSRSWASRLHLRAVRLLRQALCATEPP